MYSHKTGYQLTVTDHRLAIFTRTMIPILKVFETLVEIHERAKHFLSPKDRLVSDLKKCLAVL
jgi:hypothetical protein